MFQQNIQLCLGIDPKPAIQTFENFSASVRRHMEFLDSHKVTYKEQWLKLQLAFFLAHGSKGIAVLEEFVSKYKEKYSIILDGKFNDISTSIEAYLYFAFQTLKVHSLTISPFLGEKTLQIAFEQCAQHAGARGRIYVLCATSETGTGHLSYMQKNWKLNLAACAEVRDLVFKNDEQHKKIAGIVVGANREEVLFSSELINSNISVLAPGLGAQNADWNVIQKCAKHENEILFPISRGVFSGGNISLHETEQNLKNIRSHF